MNEKDIARHKKLEALQKEHAALTHEKQELTKNTNRRHSEISTRLKVVGQAIYDLKNKTGDTPHITDHAVVRYLERVKGVDIWSLKAEVMNHKQAVRVDNTIVTVNEELDGEKEEH